MPGPWDDIMKQLIETHPQHFTSWVLQGAQFKQILKPELQQRLYADSLLEVSFKEQDALLHFEFQSSNDARMGERLLLYNTLASHAYDYLPVYSYVIYLRRDGNTEQPPFVRYFIDGREIVRFHYGRIELWSMTAEELLAINFNGLLPLVLLTKGGTEPEIVEQMIDKLAATDERGLLTILYTLGGLVFKTQSAHDWFKRRFNMLRDILEESWTYQELKEEARQVVEQEIRPKIEQEIRPKLEEEIKKIEQQLELQRLRTAFSDIVQKRFPKLARLTKTLSMGIDDPDVLLHLIINVSTVQTLEEATELLITLGNEEE